MDRRTRNEQIRALHRDGATMEAIAADFNLTRQRVHQIIHWTPPPRPRRPAPPMPKAPPTPRQHSQLRLPVSPDLIVNVIFEGEGKLTVRALDCVIGYLRLWQEGFDDDDQNEEVTNSNPLETNEQP